MDDSKLTPKEQLDLTLQSCKYTLKEESHEKLDAMADGMLMLCEYLGLKEDVGYEKTRECLKEYFNREMDKFSETFGLLDILPRLKHVGFLGQA